MMVAPGFNAPDFSASSTMASAMRSLIEPPGLLRSDLIHTFAPAPNRRLTRTWGVLPMVWRMLSAFIGCSCGGFFCGRLRVLRIVGQFFTRKRHNLICPPAA